MYVEFVGIFGTGMKLYYLVKGEAYCRYNVQLYDNIDTNIDTDTDTDTDNDTDNELDTDNTDTDTDTDTNNDNNNNNNNNNDNNIDDPYDRLSKSIKVTAVELFNGEDNIKRRKPWFEFSKNSILERIKERNDALRKYFKEKSSSNLTKLRDSRTNLKKKKLETKTIWVASRVAELENMDVDPSTS